MLTGKSKIYILLAAAALLLCGIPGSFLASRTASSGTAASAPAAPEATGSSGTQSVAESPVPAAPLPGGDMPVFPETIDRGCDIVLIMDDSGSMNSGDPLRYRIPAAKLFISLLGTDDRIGIISAGDRATLLIPLTQNTEQNRPALFNAVERLTSKEHSASLSAAVQMGFDEIRSSARRGRILVILSAARDSKDDAGGGGLRTLLPELVKARIRLYTIAFPPASNRSLLEDLARETAGWFQFAGTGRDVHVLFSAIFEKIKVPDAIPFVEDTFTTGRDVKQATVLITKKPGAAVILIGPSGKEYTAGNHAQSMAWYASSVYDMITIADPPPSKWRVKMNRKEGNRIYILTDLVLRTSWQRNSVYLGETITIDAWIEKQGRTITDRNVLDSLSMEAYLTGPDGRMVTVPLAAADKTGERPGTGKFSGRVVIDALGDHSVRILARGEGFTRERTIPFAAVEQAEATGPLKQAVGRPRVPSGIETFSWLNVLIRLGMVNLAALAAAAFAYGTRLIIVKLRAKQ